MCDCCKKIIVQTEIGIPGPEGPEGPPGPVGPTNVTYNTVASRPVEGGFDFTHTIASNGDYILQLESYLQLSGISCEITTIVIKNGSLQSLNVNYEHRYSTTELYTNMAHTHTVKLTGLVVGDTVGFRFLTGQIATIQNASIVSTKIQ